MATHDFNAVKGTTIAFDPAADTLHFATYWNFNAAWLRFEVLGADLKVWMGNDFVILADTTYGELGTGDITFDNGSMFLAGVAGVDTLRGAGGKDFLDGRGGDDLLVGRNGDDTYVVDASGDVVFEVAGEGIDTVRALVSYTLGANIENLWIRGTGAQNGTGNAVDNRIQAGAGDNLINGAGGSDTASYEDAASAISVWLGLTTAQATGGSGTDTLLNIENLQGSAHADLLRGNGLDNVLEGRNGNDTLVGGGGNDRLYSDIAYWDGKAEDALDANLLNGNDGNDSLTGSVGLDTLYGDAGNDVLRGESGNDWLYGGDGSDNLNGADGNDFINAGAGGDFVDAGAGNDTVHGGGGGGTVFGGDGNDWIRETGSAAVEIQGGYGNDTLYGGDGSDTLCATGGSDYSSNGVYSDWLYGGLGNDTLWAGRGHDRLEGGDGIDTVSYAATYSGTGVRVNLALAAAQETLAGLDTLVGIENVIGSYYNDVLRGSSGANRLDGANGADWLLGGGGADLLVGGTGADYFVFASVADSNATALDAITDFQHAQSDRIDLSRIDADVVTAGDQAFTFIGSEAFAADATGQLRYNATNGVLYGSNDADAAAEFVLSLAGLPALVAADFVL